MRNIRVMIVTALMVATAPALASSLDVNIGSDNVRGQFTQALDGYDRYGTPYFNAGLLYSDDADALIGHAGLEVTGDAAAQNANIRAGLGGRLYYTSSDDGDGAALGLGGHATARLPQYNRFGLRAHAYYAPDIIAFQDFEEFLEYGVDFEYQLLKNGYVYVGYRQIKADLDSGGDQTLDSGAHVGLRLAF